MIVAFTGWRGWTDDLFIRSQLDRLYADGMYVRVGDAAGVDHFIRTEVGRSGNWHMTVYVANWEGEGKAAGAIRNRRMLLGLDQQDPNHGRAADLLVAFPEPGRTKPSASSGSWNCIQQAHWRGIEVRIPGYALPLMARPEVADFFSLTGGK